VATFVLVHGAWSGAEGFRHVRRILRANGHEVTTPSLTGLGERVHLASGLVNLSTHIRDVVNHILYEDLNHLVLVGFSYGGFVVTGALEHIAERVEHLVFLDAFVPKNGESPRSLVRGDGRTKIEIGEEWWIAGPVREYDNPAEDQWMTARRSGQPKGCGTEPVYLAQPLEAYPFTRTYIKATRSPESDPGNAAFWRAARHAQTSSEWRYFQIESNHMLAVNAPAETARLLELSANAA
jgi:pimeloyl-ACP methyl ester carboxylesterase